MRTQIDPEVFLSEYLTQFKKSIKSVADISKNIRFLVGKINADDKNFANQNHIAYFFATAQWETGNTLAPVTEKGPKAYFDKYNAGTIIGTRLGNKEPGDGYLFRGRGYVQLTGRGNYTRNSKQDRLGIDLVSDPDKALNPDIAYEIASKGMANGWFTGRSLKQFDQPEGGYDFVGARRIINGQDEAEGIAELAKRFRTIVNKAIRIEVKAA